MEQLPVTLALLSGFKVRSNVAQWYYVISAIIHDRHARKRRPNKPRPSAEAGVRGAAAPARSLRCRRFGRSKGSGEPGTAPRQPAPGRGRGEGGLCARKGVRPLL